MKKFYRITNVTNEKMVEDENLEKALDKIYNRKNQFAQKGDIIKIEEIEIRIGEFNLPIRTSKILELYNYEIWGNQNEKNWR